MAEDSAPSETRPGTVGALVRAGVAAFALAIGVIWIVRLAAVGSSVSGGLLFELLPPLVLLYFGAIYLRKQYHTLSRTG